MVEKQKEDLIGEIVKLFNEAGMSIKEAFCLIKEELEPRLLETKISLKGSQQ